MLGARFDAKKLQLDPIKPVLLGVTYNLVDWVLEIKADRKKELVEEIDDVLQSGSLDPGRSGKLKGKLMLELANCGGRSEGLSSAFSLRGSTVVFR